MTLTSEPRPLSKSASNQTEQRNCTSSGLYEEGAPLPTPKSATNLTEQNKLH